MSEKGKIAVRVYVSQMTIPIEGAAVYIFDYMENGGRRLIAQRKTDKNGQTEPVELNAPNKALSLSPEEDGKPFRSVNIFIEAQGYRSILIEDAQVFSGVTMVQNAEMIPLAEPAIREMDRVIDVKVTPQQL